MSRKSRGRVPGPMPRRSRRTFGDNGTEKSGGHRLRGPPPKCRIRAGPVLSVQGGGGFQRSIRVSSCQDPTGELRPGAGKKKGGAPAGRRRSEPAGPGGERGGRQYALASQIARTGMLVKWQKRRRRTSRRCVAEADHTVFGGGRVGGNLSWTGCGVKHPHSPPAKGSTGTSRTW